MRPIASVDLAQSFLGVCQWCANGSMQFCQKAIRHSSQIGSSSIGKRVQHLPQRPMVALGPLAAYDAIVGHGPLYLKTSPLERPYQSEHIALLASQGLTSFSLWIRGHAQWT